jgi:septum formation protein
MCVLLVLASQSPSRKILLGQLIPEFLVHPAHIDETSLPREKAEDYVMRISQNKGLAVASFYPDYAILSADTTVAVGRRLLGKATSEEESYRQMTLLSGRRHRVYTALCLIMPGGHISQRIAVTHVCFNRLCPKEIQQFVHSKEWQNVAVYRHEGFAARFIRSIRGVPSTIAGLPLRDTYCLLKGRGLV